MPLQFKNIAVGNLQDDVSGNNYAANKAVYILNLNNTLAQIFSDEAGTTPIVQDGVNNVTGARGVFGFWVEAGDYFVQVGANKYRVSITGADYFNNRVDETVDLIVDSVAGRGAYYPVGSFEAGFTYTDINQVGTFGGTDYYVYTGGLTNLPHNVTAGTDPTISSDYAKVFYGEIDNVQGLRDELDKLEKVYHTAVRVIEYCSGDGVVDDTQNLKDAWSAFLAFPSYNKRIDFSGGTYLIKEETLTSLFSVSDLDRLDIHFGGCKFVTDHSDTSNLQNLFDLQGCNNVTADLLQVSKPTAKAETSNTLYGFLIRNSATRGGSGYWLQGVNGKNTGGIRFQGDSADYATNGIESTLRPMYGYIDSIKIDNTDMQNNPVISTEKSGYGLACALGGDHINIGRLDTDRIHRAFFVYGVKDVHVLGGNLENADATTINIGSYGTCIDISVKARLNQDVNRSMDLVKVHGHEIGVNGGASLDLANGRTHNLFDIHLDLKATGAGLNGHDNIVNVDKFYGDSDEALGANSDYSFKNISVRLQTTSACVGAEVALFQDAELDNASNCTTQQIQVENSILPNGRVRAGMTEGCLDSILVKDSRVLYFTPKPQPSSIADTAYELENVHGLLGLEDTSDYGAFTILKDCVVNNRDGTVIAANCDPFNKIMYRTKLGNAFIEEKGRYDVYTNYNTSEKMYDPTGVENRMWGGGVRTEASVQPSIATTINIGDGAGDFTADCYIDGVVGGNFATVDNVKDVVISVSADNSSYGIFKGKLAVYGNGSDLNTLVVDLKIDTVFNIGSAAYVVGDIAFSIDKPNRTMTFTCNNSGRYMSVAIR